MDPYRTPPAKRVARRARVDRDVAGVYAFVWILALARVAIGLRLHQTFDGELSIALAAVFLLPLLARS